MVAKPAFPDGHFYSPVIDVDEVMHDRALIWPEHPSAPGIDFNLKGQELFVKSAMSRWLVDYSYPEQLPPGQEENAYYQLNSQFGPLDSRGLFTMLRERPPATMIEVGSGYSSLLTADVNVRLLDRSINFVCIEPFPRQFLVDGVDGIKEVVQHRVQEVPVEVFRQLQRGDILFIDSSHVSKTGSDVNHLYLKVLPSLNPGVLVHVHDIFLPGDYLEPWIHEGRSWNEQYLLQCMLAHSKRYKIVYGTASASYFYPELLQSVTGLPREYLYGGSIWFEVTE